MFCLSSIHLVKGEKERIIMMHITHIVGLNCCLLTHLLPCFLVFTPSSPCLRSLFFSTLYFLWRKRERVCLPLFLSKFTKAAESIACIKTSAAAKTLTAGHHAQTTNWRLIPRRKFHKWI